MLASHIYSHTALHQGHTWTCSETLMMSLEDLTFPTFPFQLMHTCSARPFQVDTTD